MWLTWTTRDHPINAITNLALQEANVYIQCFTQARQCPSSEGALLPWSLSSLLLNPLALAYIVYSLQACSDNQGP